MKIARLMATAVIITMMAAPLFAAEDDAKAFGQFQEILEGINKRSFNPVQSAIDKTDMSNRVYSARPVQTEARQAFSSSFWQFIEAGFMQNLPEMGDQFDVKLVEFAFENGQGRAAIRFRLPKYQYVFQVFDLRHDSRGRLKIVDWFDSSTGQMFSAEIAEDLVVLMPTKNGTRELISIQGPSDLQLFQVTEIFKASRDTQPPRFFEIYDQFNDELKREPFIAKNAVYMAFLIKDFDRFARTLKIFVSVFSNEPNFSLIMSDYFLILEAYEESYTKLRTFQENYGVKEGALPAKLSALALAIGKPEDAERHAIEATVNEPSLELGWWSLLRVRSSSGDFAGAIEALIALEDRFNHRLDEAKLRRDKFRGFIELAESQAFKDWRAGRN